MASSDVADLFPADVVAPSAAMVRASIAVAAAIDRAAVAPAGLEPATSDLLVRLSLSPQQRLRGVDIGRQLHIGPTKVSRLVDRAERDGYVVRTPDPDDRRAQYVSLTPDGVEAATRFAPLVSGVVQRIFGATLSPDEQVILIGMLDRISEAADTIEGVEA